MRLRINGAVCVLPGETVQTDLLVAEGRIVHVGVPAGARADETLDARGLHLLPGVIDDQVHFREPGLTHKEDLTTGSRACAKGGVTTFFDMPNVAPATTTVERLHEKLARAADVCRVNFAFFIGATPGNLRELQAAQRTPGIKVFIGSSTGDLLVDGQEALEAIFAGTTLPITAHCEDEATVRANRARVEAEAAAEGRALTPADHVRVRDHAAARISAARALDLARRHRHRFHLLHVTTADELALLRDAKADAVLAPLITAEACHPHLFFSDADYARLGTRLLQNPSVKTQADQDALWAALHDGTLDFVATDHAPHTPEEKAQPYPLAPSGMPSIENALALMLDAVHRGRCTLEQVVQWTSTRPAAAWHVAGKGQIAEGFDADLVLVDLSETRTVRNAEQITKSGWSPWDEQALTGWPVGTFVGGQRVFWRGYFDEAVRGREAVFAR
jgi:dihydroorotase